jgi:hypothetical protein
VENENGEQGDQYPRTGTLPLVDVSVRHVHDVVRRMNTTYPSSVRLSQ